MSLVSRFVEAVKSSFAVFAAELNVMFKTEPTDEGEGQVLVERVAAVAVGAVAVFLYYVPIGNFAFRPTANSLFGLATKLWTGEKTHAKSHARRSSANLGFHPDPA